MSYVVFKGKKYYVENDKLKLNNLGIKDIDQIEGLKDLANIKKLDLSYNKIADINGLETLTNLKELNVSYNCISWFERLENVP
ncbi:MAG: leucine-rich repeat domain-containing protein, partial [Candidatus Hermodarchaeota archaeon]